MKNTLFVIATLSMAVACGPSMEGKMDFSHLTITMDTVMVDSKDEILFLKTGLNSSDLSTDKKQIYNFNNDTHTLEIIDLDDKPFKERVEFEKEGPDGVGNYVQSVYSIDGEKLLISAFMQSGMFDLQGKKIQNINLKDLSGDPVGRGEMLTHPLIHPDYPNHLVGLYNDFSFQSVHFGKIDLEQKSILSLYQRWQNMAV